MTKRRHSSRGMTLVELLVVLSFMTVVLGVLLATLSGGFRVWERTRCAGGKSEELRLSLEKMKRDIHHYHPFGPIPIDARYDRFSFPSFVTVAFESEDGEQIDEAEEPGQISYSYSRRDNAICRTERSFRGLARQRYKRQCKILLEGVTGVRFRYLAYDPEKKKTAWKGNWGKDDGVPVAVKVELKYKDECLQEERELETVFAVPAGI